MSKLCLAWENAAILPKHQTTRLVSVLIKSTRTIQKKEICMSDIILFAHIRNSISIRKIAES